jgi:Polysaccharide lyase family 4, domain II
LAIARDPTALNYSGNCLRGLLSYEKAVFETLNWGMEQNKTNQFWSSDADEEGNFKITDVRPGEYVVVARGRAGFNDAFWQKDITVKSGMETAFKLSKPEKACLVIE